MHILSRVRELHNTKFCLFLCKRRENEKGRENKRERKKRSGVSSCLVYGLLLGIRNRSGGSHPALPVAAAYIQIIIAPFHPSPSKALNKKEGEPSSVEEGRKKRAPEEPGHAYLVDPFDLYFTSSSFSRLLVAQSS